MLTVVAHDAGAANHIFAWLRCGLIDINKTRMSLTGPALEIYRRAVPGFRNLPLEQAFEATTALISGTGWASDIEHNARIIARKRNIQSIAVIDHWTNYTMRFERHGEQILPDQIWVSDEYAAALCKHHFPSIKVQTQPNAFLDEQLHEITAFKSYQQDHILFLMEPARDNWGNPPLAGEFQAFDYFARHFNHFKRKPAQKVIIKPHPSDHDGKYSHLAELYPDLNISIDTTSPLPMLIASASIVAGCQTYAMIIALHADKQVISVLPPHAPRCVLPQDNIIHLSELIAEK